VNLLKKDHTLRQSPSSNYQNYQSGTAIVPPSNIGYNQSSNPNLLVAGMTGNFMNTPTLLGLIQQITVAKTTKQQPSFISGGKTQRKNVKQALKEQSAFFNKQRSRSTL
jgi:ABC-type polar amino acid transport system ATPase subunit